MKLGFALALLALTGCETCREHPMACAAVVATAGTCIALSGHSSSRGHDVATPSVVCANGSCR